MKQQKTHPKNAGVKNRVPHCWLLIWPAPPFSRVSRDTADAAGDARHRHSQSHCSSWHWGCCVCHKRTGIPPQSHGRVFKRVEAMVSSSTLLQPHIQPVSPLSCRLRQVSSPAAQGSSPKEQSLPLPARVNPAPTSKAPRPTILPQGVTSWGEKSPAAVGGGA